MAVAKFKLTEKEIEALALKLKNKSKAARETALELASKKLHPKAKEVLELIRKIPPAVGAELFNYSCRNNEISINKISELLVDKSKLPKIEEDNHYKGEVTLSASGCKSLAEVCKKIGV